MNQLYLKSGAARRLQRGHPWVYSNEIDVQRTPLQGLEPGASVAVVSSNGTTFGYGLVSPSNLVCVRLVQRGGDPLDDAGGWLLPRLQRALAWRERLYSEPYYRLVFAEGDGLPGLVVDRYDTDLVVQLTTWGMDRLRAVVESSLQELLPGAGIHFSDDSSARQSEGLPGSVRDPDAAPGAPAVSAVIENGLRMALPAAGGRQKTGWFYDQRDNRAAARPWFAGAHVLDLYSYAGGWGLQAAAAGAASVTCVDSAAPPLAAVAESAAQLELTVGTVQAKAEDFMARAAGEEQRFDVVVLDPPALVKRRRDLNKGTAKYRALNRAALNLVAADGLLVSCSCSVHLDATAHLAMVRSAARAARRQLSVVGAGGLGADHPTDPMLPESRYLSCWYFRVD